MNNIKALAYLLLIMAFLPICCNTQSCSYSNCATDADCCPCSFSINCCITPYNYYNPHINASGVYGLWYPYPGYDFYHPVTAVYNATGNYPYYYCPNGYCRHMTTMGSACNNNTCVNELNCINGTPNFNVICGNYAALNDFDCHPNNNVADISVLVLLKY
jgi:hypothetical protein